MQTNEQWQMDGCLEQGGRRDGLQRDMKKLWEVMKTFCTASCSDDLVGVYSIKKYWTVQFKWVQSIILKICLNDCSKYTQMNLNI